MSDSGAKMLLAWHQAAGAACAGAEQTDTECVLVEPGEFDRMLERTPPVIGIPHSELGEEVAAAIVLKPGAHFTPGELRDFVKERIAAYKYPRQVWLVDELPVGPTGKILKREIKPPVNLETPPVHG